MTSLATVLLVALGGALGASLRYLSGRVLDSHPHHAWPRGTLLVNLVGSLLLGALLGAAVEGPALALLATGLCGGLTTYSSFAVQSVELGPRRGSTYVTATIVGCLLAATLGWLASAAWLAS
jgi:CrcB protein